MPEEAGGVFAANGERVSMVRVAVVEFASTTGVLTEDDTVIRDTLHVDRIRSVARNGQRGLAALS